MDPIILGIGVAMVACLAGCAAVLIWGNSKGAINAETVLWTIVVGLLLTPLAAFLFLLAHCAAYRPAPQPRPPIVRRRTRN